MIPTGTSELDHHESIRLSISARSEISKTLPYTWHWQKTDNRRVQEKLQRRSQRTRSSWEQVLVSRTSRPDLDHTDLQTKLTERPIQRIQNGNLPIAGVSQLLDKSPTPGVRIILIVIVQ